MHHPDPNPHQLRTFAETRHNELFPPYDRPGTKLFTEIVNGLPVLDEYLRLPRSNFFIMGGLAALQIGPVARNIGGGKMAGRLIVPAIVKPSLAIES